MSDKNCHRTRKVLRRGKVVEVDEQIFRWRKRMKRFRKAKEKLLSHVVDVLGQSQAEVWLNKPHQDLGNAPPRQFINPKQIQDLLRWTRRALREELEARPGGTPTSEPLEGVLGDSEKKSPSRHHGVDDVVIEINDSDFYAD